MDVSIVNACSLVQIVNEDYSVGQSFAVLCTAGSMTYRRRIKNNETRKIFHRPLLGVYIYQVYTAAVVLHCIFFSVVVCGMWGGLPCLVLGTGRQVGTPGMTLFLQYACNMDAGRYRSTRGIMPVGVFTRTYVRVYVVHIKKEHNNNNNNSRSNNSSNKQQLKHSYLVFITPLDPQSRLGTKLLEI